MEGFYIDEWLVIYFDNTKDKRGWLKWLSDNGVYCSSHEKSLLGIKPLDYFQDLCNPTEIELDMLAILEPDIHSQVVKILEYIGE